MPYSIFYLTLIVYWLFFFRHILFKPYSICASEALTYDFGNTIQAGRCWRKGKLPTDPYHFDDFMGVCMGLLYPINIICAYISSFVKLDTTWKIQVLNLLGHNLLMSFFAFHLFNVYHNPYIALFGALAWSYASWHIKQSLWYTQSFCWITATLTFLELKNPVLAGVSLGMLYLSGHPRLFTYFTYLLVGYFLVRWWFPIKVGIIALLIGGYQLYRYYRYSKNNIAFTRTYEEKVAIGRIPWWYYITMFIPWRSNGYLFGMGYQEVTFYVTPLIGYFALFSRGHSWIQVPLCIILSSGGWLFKVTHKLMARFPQYWGYFAMLGMVVLGVDGLTKFSLQNKQLILLDILLAVMLLRNSNLLPLYPLSQWTKKPSEWFNTPLMRYFENNCGQYKVNNLPYPVYRGQVNKIRTVGYTGGNHTKELGRMLSIPRDGIVPYNWFEFMPDDNRVEAFGIKYHLGDRPSDNPKWVKIEEFDNLWMNTYLSIS